MSTQSLPCFPPENNRNQLRMPSSAESTRMPSLDLEALEGEHEATFVVRTGIKVSAFDFIFCNRTFRNDRDQLKEVILASNRDALLFRSWVLALGDFHPIFKFANWEWSAVLAGKLNDFKIVRGINIAKGDIVNGDGHAKEHGKSPAHSPTTSRTHQEILENMKNAIPLIEKAPHTNLKARWESLQIMMDMSDVGVFEYSAEGRLIHANAAWYRLSSHPLDLPAHSDYSFMDLVYEEDRDLVMSMWNTLSLGQPVTFEMRWKPRPGTDDIAQWVLSACVPVFDDEGNLASIAGNTVDINGQKKSQEATQARLEALEQARQSEQKFTRFAQLSPTAIYILVPGSGMKYANEQFFELTGYTQKPVDKSEWFGITAEEDIDRVTEAWDNMLAGHKNDPIQFRLKKQWVNQDGISSNIWVQSSSYPELDEDGKVSSIMGTLFDISQFKWAESVQRRRINEALEAKRQQENFIDMTSHELRNPLSAVVQCADHVTASLHEMSIPIANSDKYADTKMRAEISTCIDSLQTIVSCSLHSKRVIDDVLTLSKLDSNLILITPMRVEPEVVVSDAIKMFEVECGQIGLQLNFKVDSSLKGMEWVMMDPSRLLQILINLLTNAIKFTKDRPKRYILVTLGGSWSRPPEQFHGITFTNKVPETNVVDKPEWGRGQRCYIWLKVQDTGCGMTQKEQKKLFSRFSQATPRTHVQYGGSGLGLFISKSLSNLQGGAISLVSEKDVGSTFAFYISSRIARPPANRIQSPGGSELRPLPYRTVSTEDALKGMKLQVLIVEDNLVNQKVLKKQLQKFGWNISVAGNGAEAIEWLKQSVYWRGSESSLSPPTIADHPHGATRQDSGGNNEDDGKTARHELDLILMDIEMPIMDGLTCARMIRTYEAQGLLASPHSTLNSLSPGLPMTPISMLKKPEGLSRNPSASSVSPISPVLEVGTPVMEQPGFDFGGGQTTTVKPAVSNGSSSSRSGTTPGAFRIPILAVSANARTEQIEEALNAGMDDAIAKPFRVPELWPKIKNLVAQEEGLGIAPIT